MTIVMRAFSTANIKIIYNVHIKLYVHSRDLKRFLENKNLTQTTLFMPIVVTLKTIKIDSFLKHSMISKRIIRT